LTKLIKASTARRRACADVNGIFRGGMPFWLPLARMT
jgi:hypothetical protein